MNVLILSHPGTNSRSIFLDTVRGFEQAGHRTFVLELEPVWRMYEREPARRDRAMADISAVVAHLCRANRIDLSLAMWGNGLLSLMHGVREAPSAAAGKEPVSFFEAAGVPHVCFWLDAPHWAHSGQFRTNFRSPLLKGPFIRHVTNNPATAREMTDVLGFSHVLARPYGVNEAVFRPHADAAEDDTREFDIVFGSGPGDPKPSQAALEELDRPEPDFDRVRHAAAERLLPELDALAERAPDHLRREAREALRMLARTQLARRHAPVLDRLNAIAAEPALRAGAEALTSDPALFVDATASVRSIESAERAFTIAYLSRHFRCAVFGSTDLSAWGFRGTALGEVAYEDQARMYSRGRIGLNAMRWQDDAGVNLKPFEISACGVPCLCARRTGLESLFTPGAEIEVFDSPADARAKAAALLADAPRRRAIAGAGRARTLRDHTWTTWAHDIARWNAPKPA